MYVISLQSCVMGGSVLCSWWQLNTRNIELSARTTYADKACAGLGLNTFANQLCFARTDFITAKLQMKLVVLGGIVSYFAGLHKYYEPEVPPVETDESSNTFPINIF